MTLRTIEPIDIATMEPGVPPTGMPIFEQVDPRTLRVDPAYQRSLGERGLRQIRRIVENFDWTKFQPPVCAYAEDEDGNTVLKVIDGQHTATAAASNPHVPTIPIMIVDAPDVQAQAKAFIGQNTDRLGVTATQMHVAALAAGDEEAQALAHACARAGARIRKNPPSGGTDYEPGETMAVAAIAALLRKAGPDHVVAVLQICTAAKLAPIKADHIKAVDLLLTDPEFGALDLDALPAHIAAQGLGALKEAGVLAYGKTIPLWKGLASVWFKKAKKVRQTRPRNVEDEADDEPSLRHSSLADDPVPDMRPAKGGWRPGNQVCRCRRCDKRFVGGPGAKQCAPCAYEGDGQT